MALWKKLWLLFTVIWVIVAGLNAGTILAFAEDVERGKALTPLFLAFAVPALAYLLGWLWQAWRARR
ncbi:MAG TPA: hypothetical protein VIQ55_07905 [Burkholderiales bacterium]|jgi:hypothetical protein